MKDFQTELFLTAVKDAENKGDPIADTDLFQQHPEQWDYKKFNEIRIQLIRDGIVGYNDDDKLVMVKK